MKRLLILFLFALVGIYSCKVADTLKDKYTKEEEVNTEDVLAEIKGEPKKTEVQDTITKPISKREKKRLEKEQRRREKILSGDTLNFFEKTFPKRRHRDTIYSKVYAEKPHSILILPPYNRSKQQYGDKMVLTTLTKELGMKGYYLYPSTLLNNIAQTDTSFNARYQTAADVKDYLEEFGADAVLFITIYSINKEWWSTKTEISADYTMISTHSGDTLFRRQANFAYSSPFPFRDRTGKSLLATEKEIQMLEAVEALQHYVFIDFPYGPYHKEYLKDKKKFSHTGEMDYNISTIPE
ncbi:MAG: DUF799 domain-containing protein [Bacteroidales bacterium]|jgi:hypothetical protein|nr:DUF799 domain-containing protein [Bacteroidales bacterium]